MLLPSFGMWAALHIQPDMFSTSPSYNVIARWGSWAAGHGWTAESMMAVVLLTVGVIRLAALTINGTFHQFRFSPHLRFAASVAGLVVWSQWSLGFILAYLSEGGALSGPIAYLTFCALELANFSTSIEDMGGELKRMMGREQRER